MAIKWLGWWDIFVCVWIGFWFRIAYLLHLRTAWCKFVRLILGEWKHADKLTVYATPDELHKRLEKCIYRKDPMSGKLDYCSDPLYIQWLMNQKEDAKIGDCDDFHWYAANALRIIEGVSDVYFLCSSFRNEKRKPGGHATVVYRYQGSWWHFDYQIRPISDPYATPFAVAQRYGKDPNNYVSYWVFESVVPWAPKAIWPDKLAVA